MPSFVPLLRHQTSSQTVLVFTRPLAHATWPISTTGSTNMVWAYGGSNSFVQHVNQLVGWRSDTRRGVQPGGVAVMRRVPTCNGAQTLCGSAADALECF